MTEKKRMTAETKLTEETKLFEEKKTTDPFIPGLLSLCQKQTQRRLLKRYLKVCLKILMTVIVVMRKVEMKILKIGPGDRAILSSENRLLNRVILTT
jgi:hypothetical protein